MTSDGIRKRRLGGRMGEGMEEEEEEEEGDEMK